jgi:DNA-directed RNA polymerase subunit RPC12/RpoP
MKKKYRVIVMERHEYDTIEADNAREAEDMVILGDRWDMMNVGEVIISQVCDYCGWEQVLETEKEEPACSDCGKLYIDEPAECPNCKHKTTANDIEHEGEGEYSCSNCAKV